MLLWVDQLSNTSTDAFLEGSDEEILGYSPSEDEDDDAEDDDDDEEDDEEEEYESKSKTRPKVDVSSVAGASGDEDDVGGWGSSKRDYYNTDVIETEADAQEEEAEARRLQQKKLQKMSEADFGFDEGEWMDTKSDENDGDIVTEVLKDVEITPEMKTEERLRILHTRYPEFELLADELLQLQPVLEELQLSADTTETEGVSQLSILKTRALSAYIGSLTMYFAILTSPAKSGKSTAAAFDPLELRDHSIMESLLKCRELWSKVKDLKTPNKQSTDFQDAILSEVEERYASIEPIQSLPTKKSKKERAREAAATEVMKSRATRMQATEAELAELSALIPKGKRFSKKPKAIPITQPTEDDDSDFGEETHLDARAAADKAQKKKSLRFYTSQIAQKANRRADAGRDAGGDADLPYRERLRDRQARLNAEAEKRGKKLDSYGRGTELGGEDSADEDAAVADEVRGDEDEYYDLVAQKSSEKKADKKEKYDAIAAAKAANGLVRVVEGEVDADGKRAIGYVISKNKGLAPKRKKEVRNPRVKKRMKYEEKMKKLSSVRAVYKGGEGRGGYGGEKTGIKTGLVKSVKL